MTKLCPTCHNELQEGESLCPDCIVDDALKGLDEDLESDIKVDNNDESRSVRGMIMKRLIPIILLCVMTTSAWAEVLIKKDSFFENKKEYNVDYRMTENTRSQLKEILGVENVNMFNYKVWIWKGELFTWTETEPRVLKVLNNPPIIADVGE